MTRLATYIILSSKTLDSNQLWGAAHAGKRLNVGIVMYSEEKIALGTSDLIAGAGYMIELNWECSNAFSRSGSLIVCAGIIFGYLDLKGGQGRNRTTDTGIFSIQG